MREAPFPWLPADQLQAARVIAYGRRINDYIGKAPPDNLADFLARLGDLPEVSLPSGVFFCPVSDDPLPSVYAEQIRKMRWAGWMPTTFPTAPSASSLAHAIHAMRCHSTSATGRPCWSQSV